MNVIFFIIWRLLYSTLCLDKESSQQKASHRKARSRFTFSWNWYYVIILVATFVIATVANYDRYNEMYREGPHHFGINFAVAILQYLLMGHDSMINAAEVSLAATCSISLVVIDGVQYLMITHFDALMEWLGFLATIGTNRTSRSVLCLNKLVSGVGSYGWREAWISRMQRSLFSNSEIGDWFQVPTNSIMITNDAMRSEGNGDHRDCDLSWIEIFLKQWRNLAAATRGWYGNHPDLLASEPRVYFSIEAHGVNVNERFYTMKAVDKKVKGRSSDVINFLGRLGRSMLDDGFRPKSEVFTSARGVVSRVTCQLDRPATDALTVVTPYNLPPANV